MLATWVQEQYEVQVINAMYHSRLFSKRVFDAVTFIQVLEHLENPLEILCAAYSHLKPGGLLVVDVPSFNNPRVIAYRATRCKRLVRMDFIPSHCHYYTRRTLVNLVREAGFQVVRVETGRYGVKFGKQGLMIRMIDRIACWLGVGGITLYAVKSEGRQR
jgi:predicted SAM-dependent methyltransferase